MFERCSERARRVLFFARYEASQLGSLSIESEHLLLGLMREGKGVTARVFARARIPLERVRKEIEGRAVVHEKVPTSVEIPFSAETKRILQRAAEEADGLRHGYIGTEHLLLGILREDRSGAASILLEHGMHLEAVREDVVHLLHDAPTGPAERSRSAWRRDDVLQVQLLRMDRIIADVEALASRLGEPEATATILHELRLLRAWLAGQG